jgi:hypothetical protein
MKRTVSLLAALLVVAGAMPAMARPEIHPPYAGGTPSTTWDRVRSLSMLSCRASWGTSSSGRETLSCERSHRSRLQSKALYRER